MIDWCIWKESAGNPPIRLIAQLHDELIFEVDTSEVAVQDAVQVVKKVMEGAVELRVPLVVNVKAGERWGSMKKVGI